MHSKLNAVIEMLSRNCTCARAFSYNCTCARAFSVHLQTGELQYIADSVSRLQFQILGCNCRCLLAIADAQLQLQVLSCNCRCSAATAELLSCNCRLQIHSTAFHPSVERGIDILGVHAFHPSAKVRYANQSQFTFEQTTGTFTSRV